MKRLILLAIAVAVGTVCGFWIECAAFKEGPDADDVAKIESLGGQVQTRSELKSLEAASAVSFDSSRQGHNTGNNGQPDDAIVAVNLIGSQTLKDDDLRCLQSFPELTNLNLGRTRISDAGLKHISDLKHLNVLWLFGTRITDAGLKQLEGLPELHDLLLNGTAITDAGLLSIGKLKSLRALSVGSTRITGAGLKDVEALPSLTDFHLTNTRFNDASVAELAKFFNLRELSLNGTPISDAGLNGLANLPKLSFLDLSGTRITDAGLERLARLKSLKILLTNGTEVTSGGLARLKTSLPHLQFERPVVEQRNDPDFDVSVPHPAYANKHPAVCFDEAHRNFHTAGGRYKAFADLITNDGYRVTRNRQTFTPQLLAEYDLLVTANARAKSTAKRQGSRSAFTDAECDTLENWVRDGGAPLLITDHEPFASGSAELARRFGVNMSLLYTVDPSDETKGALAFSRDKNQLGDHAILRGRDASERVNRVLTFGGQSLKGPTGSASLLKFADTAVDVGHGKMVSAAGRAQGIAFKFGRGRVVVMGEAGDLSAEVLGNPPIRKGMNVPGCDNRQFAPDIVHWLSGAID